MITTASARPARVNYTALAEFRYDANDRLTRTIRYAGALSTASLASLTDAQGKPTGVALSTIRPSGYPRTDLPAHVHIEVFVGAEMVLISEVLFADDPRLTPEQREYLELVRSSADSLLGLINDILDFSKIEAGKLDIDRIDFDLGYALDETIRILAPSAHQKGLELALHVHPDVPPTLRGDPARLRQVIVNLVSNAIKFTKSGGSVEVDVRRGETMGEVSVTDTGSGMPPDVSKRAFEPFFTTKPVGKGTGLGLSMVYGFVKEMKGKIKVTSEIGKGTTFSIFFPRSRAVMEVEAPTLVPVQKPVTGDQQKTILVVDDDDRIRELLKGYLARAGFRVTAAAGGAPARKLMESLDFDLAVFDVMMPGEDGFSLTKWLREQRGPAGRTPVLLSLLLRIH